VHNFRRHSEPDRREAGAKASRDDHVPAALHDVPIGEPRAVTGRDEALPWKRNSDLAAMGVAGQRKANARPHLDEDVRLVRQEDHWVARRQQVERTGKIVFAAKSAASEPVRQLVPEAPEAGDPEAGLTFAKQNGPVLISRHGMWTLSNARRTARTARSQS
jgi:hypothetical protein